MAMDKFSENRGTVYLFILMSQIRYPLYTDVASEYDHTKITKTMS